MEGTHSVDASHPLADQVSARDKLMEAMFQGVRWRGCRDAKWEEHPQDCFEPPWDKQDVEALPEEPLDGGKGKLFCLLPPTTVGTNGQTIKEEAISGRSDGNKITLQPETNPSGDEITASSCARGSERVGSGSASKLEETNYKLTASTPIKTDKILCEPPKTTHTNVLQLGDANATHRMANPAITAPALPAPQVPAILAAQSPQRAKMICATTTFVADAGSETNATGPKWGDT